MIFIGAVAASLGLRTPTRCCIFNLLVTTPGGPEATAISLLNFCYKTQAVASGDLGPIPSGIGNGSRKACCEWREREAVQVVLHVLLAERPFNRFYARVLGGLLNHHRRFQL
ncbi:unnamed protein product [Protopolystoma xenopodis]|uniref:Uncharacterized protein n=1 Tax=Protopolystoma xenopodis TaxID=117903 RepID=A0A3S5C0P2_9PLAT|nr:unnamed protein product [Protopolystoma xenopodis]